jgi:hypothetical protein
MSQYGFLFFCLYKTNPTMTHRVRSRTAIFALPIEHVYWKTLFLVIQGSNTRSLHNIERYVPVCYQQTPFTTKIT